MKPKLNTVIALVAIVLLMGSCSDRLLEMTEAAEEKPTAIRLARTRPNRSAELENAKELYYRYEKAQEWLQPQNSDGIKRTLINDAYMPCFQGDPSWKHYAVSSNDSLMVVDVDMTDCVVQDFVPEENKRRYLATGDERYRRSYTRYVYIRNLRDGSEDAYYMTIVPSVKYAERYNNRIRRNLYLSRDKKLDGIVLFHSLAGMFVNGWQYSDGKIVGKILPHGILPANKVKGILKLKRAKAKYKVSMKVSFQRATSNDNEEDGITGPTLPELEVIGDNGKDDGEDGDDFGGLGGDPDPDTGENPELEDPNSGTSGGGSGSAGLSGSDASASLTQLKAELKALLNIEFDKVEEKDRKALAELLETIRKIMLVPFGKTICDFLKADTNIRTEIIYKNKENSRFNKTTEILYFKSSETTNILGVAEELSHAYQYYFSYGDMMTPEILNFEFEAKVMSEAIARLYGEMYGGVTSVIRDICGDEYESLQNELIQKRMDYTLYFSCLERWANYMNEHYKSDGSGGLGYHGEYDKNLNPEALWRMINEGYDPNK